MFEFPVAAVHEWSEVMNTAALSLTHPWSELDNAGASIVFQTLLHAELCQSERRSIWDVSAFSRSL